MIRIFISLLALSLLSSCIGDDIVFDSVPESVRILNPVDSIAVGDTLQLAARYTNNIGQEETRPIIWKSSVPALLAIDEDGLAVGLAPGDVTVAAEVVLANQTTVMDAFNVVVAEQVIVDPGGGERSGSIRSTSSYLLQGDFTVKQDGSDIILEIADNYRASTSLPGLYLYLTNNPATVNNALEVGKVAVFDGAHSYHISGVGINDYDYLLYWCKPFSVKVGDGEMQ